MSTDNRTTLNDCSATTGWTGDDTVTVVTAAGLYYEGGSSLSTQFSNADEHMYTTSIGGTRNLAAATCWLIVKDNVIESQANGGAKYVLYDGTNDIGYEVGGYDNAGIYLSQLFNGYKFDVSNSAAFTAHVFAGSEANLSKTAVTGVGFGTLHLSKANGAVDNCHMDRFSFIANGSPALTINGGTAGTPESLTDVAADDVTNGWGLVANPSGSLFYIDCSTEIGDAGTASSYFKQSNSQIYINGVGVGAGNIDMSIIANATGTNSFVLDNDVVVSLGTASNWDLSDTNIDTMELLATQFVNNGTFTLPVTGGTSRKVDGCTFGNCGQVNPSTCTFTNNSFVGTTDANGAYLGNRDVAGLSFTSDGTGHAIYITTPGTYDYTSNTFSGYGATGTTDAVIYNNSGGAVTINVISGDTPTYRNGTSATTTVVTGQVTTKFTCNDVITKLPIQGVAVTVEVSSGTWYQRSVTITQTAGTATVSDTGHPFSTGQKVKIAGANENNYNRIKTITVINANSYSYPIDSGTTSPATGTITSTAVIIDDLTDVNGEVSDTRSFPANQPVSGYAARGTTSPLYIRTPIADTISSANGLTATVLMSKDE